MDSPKQRPYTRERYPMPEDVRKALEDSGLMTRYRLRPPYQQNDYIGWITRARLPATRQRRLDQMLIELKEGHRYMGMDYRAKTE